MKNKTNKCHCILFLPRLPDRMRQESLSTLSGFWTIQGWVSNYNIIVALYDHSCQQHGFDIIFCSDIFFRSVVAFSPPFFREIADSWKFRKLGHGRRWRHDFEKASLYTAHGHGHGHTNTFLFCFLLRVRSFLFFCSDFLPWFPPFSGFVLVRQDQLIAVPQTVTLIQQVWKKRGKIWVH